MLKYCIVDLQWISADPVSDNFLGFLPITSTLTWQ